ncbi:TIGR00299 family protein [Geoglobus ahangari]|uniref:Putative nickel insertion protein n=2 Tax=Geoglobus ahangari TaxID=113653 RepID=A0A0F7IGG4_9EURY|nr:TIGR00299 family protein [Geoglobus ahangari]
MRAAIFDCFSGASGNMILASLLNVTLTERDLEDVVRKLNLNLDFEVRQVSRKGISAPLIEVSEGSGKTRTFEEVVGLIRGSELDSRVKAESLKVFERLAVAEGRVHGRDYRKAVFHEVGGDDAIFDVVSAVIGILRLMDMGYRVFTTPIMTGRGFAETMHGRYPIPAPATLEIARESRLKLVIDGEGELLTPTGAAILAHFSEGEPPNPLMVREVSYGAGSVEREVPNVLRLILAEVFERDEIAIVETNVDDMSGEDLAFAVERIMELSHDVSVIPALGKKGRPAYLIRAISDLSNAEDVARAMMEHTTTIGVRILPAYHRVKEVRRAGRVEVEVLGRQYEVGVKVAGGRAKPEYEDLRRIAVETGISMSRLREIVKREMDEAANRE